ncbi:hypothetical protein ACFSTE_08135 [Aquimarina hainanensis]|uniref:Uncharacterized protein n=1 Tax=Aquimarina hainanensis TaxID=1578017 RepID=A0ABW5N6L0_9FLAO|nr:hypothetical protein [Aquimarina sp. TRL1]QKX05210.1 hypothetical protein HN014_09840 [Aquimarina sp. TRL1]
MKSITTLLFAILFINISFAQSKDNIFFDQKTLINKFHTIDELEELKKGELISLYKYRVREILTIIPYLALANQADVSLGDNGIKEDSQNLKVLGKHHEATTKAFEVTNNMISEFVPYADTEKIVWSILYFEEIIKKIRIGANGNF